MNRRGFLGAILAAGVAPAIVKVASLMPVRAPGMVYVPIFNVTGFDENGIAIVETYAQALARSMRETKEKVAASIYNRYDYDAFRAAIAPGLSAMYATAYQIDNINERRLA